jgi:hypothetical protein
VSCGWQYLDDANHPGACLPWDAQSLPRAAPAGSGPGAGMAAWGGTRFGCKRLPAGCYRAHVPLDARQVRRVFVDVVDLLAPHANCFAAAARRGQGSSSGGGGARGRGPAVELVSETTGDVVTLRTMAPPPGGFDDDGASDSKLQPPCAGALLCGDVRVPDVYSLKVGGEGRSRYQQANWVEPFELTYLGPMLITVEVRDESASPRPQLRFERITPRVS